VAPALCALGAGALVGAALCVPVAPAGADPVTTLQQQAAALSQQMLLEQLQIGSFEQQRSVDLAEVSVERAQLQQMHAQLATTRRRIETDLGQLRHDAVTAYVAGGTEADGTSSIFASTPSDGATAVYNEVMTGNLTSALDVLESDRHALRAEESAVQQIAAAAAQRLEAADAALAAAQSTEQQLALQRSTVTGALAVAVAREQSQQAAAAQQAAQAAASARLGTSASNGAAPPPAPAAPSAPPAAPTSTGALPPLPPFLRCVIQAESGGDYQAVSPTGQYMGAFQFAQGTWNEAARLAGLPQLIGVPPNEASPRDQDLLAIALYDADGEQPWYDPCRG